MAIFATRIYPRKFSRGNGFYLLGRYIAFVAVKNRNFFVFLLRKPSESRKFQFANKWQFAKGERRNVRLVSLELDFRVW